MKKQILRKSLFLLLPICFLGCSTSSNVDSTLSSIESSEVKEDKYIITFKIGDTIIQEIEHSKDSFDIKNPVCDEKNFYYIWEDYSVGNFNQVVLGKKCEIKDNLDITDETMINYFGRNEITSNGSTFYNSNAGFQINFIGTTLKARIEPSLINCTYTYLRIFVDGSEESNLLKITTKGTYTLVKSLKPGLHTIEAYRINSERFGDLVLKYFDGADGYIEAPFRKKEKFEFYGDSITSGYGINGLEDESSDNEDSTLAYSKQLCNLCNAEISSLAYAGASLSIPKWITSWTISKSFDQYSFTRNKEKWDFSKYIPTVVFINGGTNDSEAINSTNRQDFIDDYVSMISFLREAYPNAKIVLLYGMMGTNLIIKGAIKTVIETLQDENLFYYNCKSLSNTGYLGHPGIENAYETALSITDYLKSKGIIKE